MCKHSVSTASTVPTTASAVPTTSKSTAYQYVHIHVHEIHIHLHVQLISDLVDYMYSMEMTRTCLLRIIL